jgi:hypothetical protein
MDHGGFFFGGHFWRSLRGALPSSQGKKCERGYFTPLQHWLCSKPEFMRNTEEEVVDEVEWVAVVEVEWVLKATPQMLSRGLEATHR